MNIAIKEGDTIKTVTPSIPETDGLVGNVEHVAHYSGSRALYLVKIKPTPLLMRRHQVRIITRSPVAIRVTEEDEAIARAGDGT